MNESTHKDESPRKLDCCERIVLSIGGVLVLSGIVTLYSVLRGHQSTWTLLLPVALVYGGLVFVLFSTKRKAAFHAISSWTELSALTSKIRRATKRMISDQIALWSEPAPKICWAGLAASAAVIFIVHSQATSDILKIEVPVTLLSSRNRRLAAVAHAVGILLVLFAPLMETFRGRTVIEREWKMLLGGSLPNVTDSIHIRSLAAAPKFPADNFVCPDNAR